MPLPSANPHEADISTAPENFRFGRNAVSAPNSWNVGNVRESRTSPPRTAKIAFVPSQSGGALLQVGMLALKARQKAPYLPCAEAAIDQALDP